MSTKTKEPVEEVEEVVEYGPTDPLPLDQANYLKKVRKVGPIPARKQALLDEIDKELKRLVEENTLPGEAVMQVHDETVVGPPEILLTETEAGLLRIIATLSLLLREEWTYS